MAIVNQKSINPQPTPVVSIIAASFFIFIYLPFGEIILLFTSLLM